MNWLWKVDWQAVFVPSVSILEMVVRGTIMYFVLFLLLRFSPKRQVGAIGVGDLLVVVILADAAQNAMTGSYGSVTEGAILVATILLWNIFLDWLGYRFPAVEPLIAPRPLLLIRGGRVIRKNLEREKITDDELLSQLRLHGVADLARVETAYLEPSGHVSVVQGGPSKGGETEAGEAGPPGQA